LARRPRGFTLIEVLVVVVIAAVMTGFALLALGRGGPAEANERSLARVEAAMSALCDRALLTGSAHGARFHEFGYDFWVFGSEGWSELVADIPSADRWPDQRMPRIEIAALRLEPRRDAAPQVVCTGIEPPTPFRIEIGRGDALRSLAWP